MNRRTFLTRSAVTASALVLGRNAFAEHHSAKFFTLPPLPYPADALVPSIDKRTMLIHHDKHHAGYTRKLNAALRKAPGSMQAMSIKDLLANLSKVEDKSLMTALRQNGGGYYNHDLFWKVMAPADSTGKPSAALSKAIDQSFGSLKQLQEQMNQAGKSQFGSGWAWLIVQDGDLKIISTPNQDNPLMEGLVSKDKLGTPILGVDVWEHAYYLKYQNRRGAYLDAWWNVVNWDEVSKNYDHAV